MAGTMRFKLTAYEPDCWVWLVALVWRGRNNRVGIKLGRHVAFVRDFSVSQWQLCSVDFRIRHKTPACLYLGLPDSSKSPKEYAAIQSQMDHVQVMITCRQDAMMMLCIPIPTSIGHVFAAGEVHCDRTYINKEDLHSLRKEEKQILGPKPQGDESSVQLRVKSPANKNDVQLRQQGREYRCKRPVPLPRSRTRAKPLAGS